VRTIILALMFLPAATPWGAGELSSLPFSCRTWFYADVKDLLIPGDVIYAMAIRGPGAPGGQAPGLRQPVWDPAKFAAALQELSTVDVPGIRKSLVLSSCEDLQREIARIPRDIETLCYNSEAGMTPWAELQNLATHVPRFAAVAHAYGFRAAWAPTNHMLTRDPALLDLARHVDGLGLQHQRVLQGEGLETFGQRTRERARQIKAANKACEVTVQLVLERTPASQIIQAFRAVSDCVDRVGVWTMRDRAGLRAVLEGLCDLRQDRPPTEPRP